MRGSASSSDCPKAGFIRLEKMGHRITLPTTCKAWSCLSCRDQLKAYVTMRMESGCSKGGPGFLITVTYVMAAGKMRDAKCANSDWTELIRMLRKHSPEVMWFKVPELTKKGQIHFHAMMLQMPQRVHCCEPSAYGRCNHKKTKQWHMAPCRKDCIEHELGKLWYQITSDSWVVDARPIFGAADAASYLSKYLIKSFDNRHELFRRGFSRRWSCSRNWPSPARMQLAVTVAGGWDTVNFMGAASIMRDALRKEVKASLDDGWAIRIGEPLAEHYETRRKRRKLAKRKAMIYD